MNNEPTPIRTLLNRIPLVRDRPGIAALAALILLVVLGWGLRPDPDATANDGSARAYFKVRKGPLTVSLLQGGTIVSREQFTVATDLTWDTTFLWLVDEGSEVKEGERLAELDATIFTDRKDELDIQLIANKSEMARAENELKVALNESEAAIAKAVVDLKLAEMNLKKYEEGEYPQRLMELDTEISIAREELKRAEDKLEGSRQLSEKGYITGSELQADTLAHTRAKIALQLAEGAKDIYEKYTHLTQLETLSTDVEQKRLTLQRVRHQATSRQQFSETNLANQQAQLQQREARLRRLEKDIRNCNLYAPADGMVIYATTVLDGRNYTEPFAVGREVDERQDVFYIPSSGLRNAEFEIHESHLEMADTGMTARVEVEAIPHTQFDGMVSDIAVMPNQDDQWSNPNLKAFSATVELNTNDDRLRTGMSCMVEVILHRYDDVHYVPVQAVTQRNGRPCVYVRNGGSPERRTVEVGLSDNRMTAILSGLEAGEEVLLAPPLAMDESDESTPDDTNS